MINSALFNDMFLNDLFRQREREIYAKITTLTYNEYPIESIEGKVSGGSINVDGSSIIRRSCSINLVAPRDLEINGFAWGTNTKFKLEIGLSNKVNSSYDEVIWFPQGIFLITNFSYNYTASKCDISIKGKDKMCLLNGEVGGVIPHTTEFHIEQYHDLETDTVTYTDIPIKNIIQEMIKNFGNEQPSNIILNGIEEAGLELLEYRGKQPMFLIRSENSDVFENITFNAEQECYYLDSAARLQKSVIGDSKNIIYDNLVNLEGELSPTKIVLTLERKNQITEEEFYLNTYYCMHKQFYSSVDEKYFINNNNKYFIDNNKVFELAREYDPNETYYTIGDYYYIAKFETGSCPGYKLTDLTYAGDLIANAGDTITSVLDKIKNMLGDFEYFYNLDGKFVFQRNQKYASSNWQSSESDEVIYNDAGINIEKSIFSFLNNELITSIKNDKQIANIKNDYSVWGSRQTDSGVKQEIHARYAIDIKPEFYKSYSGDYYISNKKHMDIIQKELHNTILNSLTPMINVGNISKLEFEDGIYYKASLQYYASDKYFINESKKYFVLLKNYTFDKIYDENAIYYKPVNSKVHFVDWRELIYQMAIDYRRHYHDTDFLYQIAINNKDFYPSGITGYERYYTDMEAFWRELYNPDPEPISKFLSPNDANNNYQGSDDLYVTNSFRKLIDKEKDQFLVDLSKLYILDYDYESNNQSIAQVFIEMRDKEISSVNTELENYNEIVSAIEDRYTKLMSFMDIHETPEIVPFLGSKYCHLNYNSDGTKSDETYFFQDGNGQMNNGTDDIDTLNRIPLNNIYIKERGPFITLEGYDEETKNEIRYYYYVKGRVEADEIWPEINDGQIFPEDENDIEIKPNYGGYANQLFGEDFQPFYDKNNSMFLIQKISVQDIEPIQNQKVFSLTRTRDFRDNPSIYQYWVYKYPFGTNLGDYPDDYVNYAAQEFEKYLNEYGWNKLYIKDSTPIKFSELDSHVQRLYYKQAQRLTEFLNILQYDNFNQLKTNSSELEALLPAIIPSEYSSLESFQEYIETIMLTYIGEYSTSAQNKMEFIYNMEKADNETEKTFLNKIKNKLKEYYDWLESMYEEKLNQPYYLLEPAQYSTVTYDFNIDEENGDYWSKMITESPELLNFWFDFINGETSFLSQYSIQTIGPRPKVINDTGVKAIYYKEVPNIIFINSQEEKMKYDIQTGYNYIQLPQEMVNIFVTSSRGKSATQAIEDLIYQHCYATESTTLQTIPIYHLQPNMRIYINDKISNINSDYLISKISIPLEAKKQMSITATKIIPSIL